MIILLNGENLDVTLEDEKTVFDVIGSLNKELNKKEIVITSVNIDDKNYSVDDTELTGMLLRM